MRTIGAALFLSLIVSPILFAGNANRMDDRPDDPLEGKPAPQFVLSDLRGRSIGLSQFRGRPVMLVFFRPEAPESLSEAEQLLRDHPKSRTVGIAIAVLSRKGRGDDASKPGKGRPYGRPAQPAFSPLALQQLANIRTELGLLIDGTGAVAAAYQSRRGGMVLIDEQGTIRVRSFRHMDRQKERIEDQLAVFAGDAPDKHGWRTDISFALDVALGRRDRQGRPVIAGKSKAMVPPPQQSLNMLKMVLPPGDLNIKVNYDPIPEDILPKVKEAVEYAKAAWEKALPSVKLDFVNDRDDADVIINFMAEVLDPRDATGVRTVCSYYRTLDEEAPGKGKGSGPRPDRNNEHRIKTIGQIAFGHSRDGVQHSQRAIAHMAAGAIGYALGLDDRNDRTSVMHSNVDEGQPAIVPSREDLLILRGISSALYFHIGKIQLDLGRRKDAEDAFAKIAPNSRYAQQARDAMNLGPSSERSSLPGNQKEK